MGYSSWYSCPGCNTMAKISNGCFKECTECESKFCCDCCDMLTHYEKEGLLCQKCDTYVHHVDTESEFLEWIINTKLGKETTLQTLKEEYIKTLPAMDTLECSGCNKETDCQYIHDNFKTNDDGEDTMGWCCNCAEISDKCSNCEDFNKRIKL